MKWLWRGLLGLALLLGGFWLWTVLHPSPHKVIRQRLEKLARQVSFTPGESDLTRLGKIASLPDFFSEEVEVELSFGDQPVNRTITHELIQVAGGELRRTQPAGLEIEFLDTTVAVASDGESASAELTMKASNPGQRDFNIQEMKFLLRREKDRWLIHRAETVKTLK